MERTAHFQAEQIVMLSILVDFHGVGLMESHQYTLAIKIYLGLSRQLSEEDWTKLPD